MDSFTPNYGLLFPSTAEDFVDVESQLNNNLLILDDVLYRNVNYKFFDNVKQSNLPISGINKGDKLYTTYDHSVKVWNGTDWVNTRAATPIWTDVLYNTGFIPTGNPEDVVSPGYYVENNTVHTRGIFYKNSQAAWVQGQAVNVFPVGTFPAPTSTRSKAVMGGSSTSNTAQWYQVDIRTDGSMYISKYGATAQTAGNAENYVSINGLWYELG